MWEQQKGEDHGQEKQADGSEREDRQGARQSGQTGAPARPQTGRSPQSNQGRTAGNFEASGSPQKATGQNDRTAEKGADGLETRVEDRGFRSTKPPGFRAFRGAATVLPLSGFSSCKLLTPRNVR